MTQLTPKEIGYIVRKAIYLRNLERIETEINRQKEEDIKESERGEDLHD